MQSSYLSTKHDNPQRNKTTEELAFEQASDDLRTADTSNRRELTDRYNAALRAYLDTVMKRGAS